MDLIPLALIQEGGPWVLLLVLALAVVFLIVRGVLVPGPHVDRTLAAYVETNKNLKEELTWWRSTAQAKDATIETQAQQLQKLMAYSAVGTHALEDILKEARRRGSDA